MATRYVRKTGSDSGTTGPFKTIQYGVNQLESGDVLIVSDGVYKEQVDITENNVTIRAENKGRAIIDGGWDYTTLPEYSDAKIMYMILVVKELEERTWVMF